MYFKYMHELFGFHFFFFVENSEALLQMSLRFTVVLPNEYCYVEPAPYNATNPYDCFHGTILLSFVFLLCFVLLGIEGLYFIYYIKNLMYFL